MIKVEQLESLLPQTQCKECGFNGCRPYAEALAQGQVAINLCPPGGADTVINLGQYLNIDPSPYIEAAKAKTRSPSRAIIREQDCIGCTKCIQACPVDAIVGSAKHMHSIIQQECTGCGLCVEPCPVDCIDMEILDEPAFNPNLAKERFNARVVRNLRLEHEKQQAYRAQKNLQKKEDHADIRAKQAFILEALSRSQAKKR
jgi:electron transport complex protein RnfB